MVETSRPLVSRSHVAALAFVITTIACTSLGHQARAVPKIAKPAPPLQEVALDGDDNALAIGIEQLLERRGMKVRIPSRPEVREQRGDKEYTYLEVQTRYLIRVRSDDLDTCVPEGTRQMHFTISVVDFEERSRIFLMTGDFGCQGTLLKQFEQWLDRSKSGG